MRHKGCDDGIHSRHGDALADTEHDSDQQECDQRYVCSERGEECGQAPDENAGGEDGNACESVCEDAAEDLSSHVANEKGGLDLALNGWGIVVLVGEGDDGDGEVYAIDVADDEGEEGMKDEEKGRRRGYCSGEGGRVIGHGERDEGGVERGGNIGG